MKQGSEINSNHYERKKNRREKQDIDKRIRIFQSEYIGSEKRNFRNIVENIISTTKEHWQHFEVSLQEQ